jgi:hypothetical protein
MDTTYMQQDVKVRPAPGRKTYRQNTEWSKMSNDDLKFALDVLSLHHSPFEVDAANEIGRRIERGTWLQLDSPVPTMAEDVPALFHVFPFSLLWKQRPQR